MMKPRAVTVALGCLLAAGLPDVPAQACTTFCMDTPDGPVYGANCDLFIAGDGLVMVNKRGVAKRSFREGSHGETAAWVSTYGNVTFNLVGREFALRQGRGGLGTGGGHAGGGRTRGPPPSAWRARPAA